MNEIQGASDTTILLTAQEAADYLRIPLGSLYVRISKRQMSCIRIGRLLRFRKAELDKLLEKHSTSLAEDDDVLAGKAG